MDTRCARDPRVACVLRPSQGRRQARRYLGQSVRCCVTRGYEVHGLGLGIADHVEPFQCSTKGIGSSVDGMTDWPTAMQ